MTDNSKTDDNGIKEVYGLPKGNTIAVVGDPGTGKTTILLSFLKYVRIARGVVRLSDDKDIKLDDKVTSKFDALFYTSIKTKKTNDNDDQRKPSLHCFISLENSFKRTMDHHQNLLPKKWNKDHPIAGASPDDNFFFFIDATSFLSGRLEDSFRYPNLRPKDANNTQNNSCPFSGTKCYQKTFLFQFSLGGFDVADQAMFGLYWQGKNKTKPERIDRLSQRVPCMGREQQQTSEESKENSQNDLDEYCTGCEPFCIQDSCPNRSRIYELLTPPIPDPQKRVRLLKDLLAEIFTRFSEHYQEGEIFLCIDSLSALLAELEANNVVNENAQSRRLHILNFIRWLEEIGVTSLLACEANRNGQTIYGEELFLGSEEKYLASGVIQLDYHRYHSGDLIRYFRVLKMRGCRHDMRPHAYELCKDGIDWIEPLVGEYAREDNI